MERLHQLETDNKTLKSENMHLREANRMLQAQLQELSIQLQCRSPRPSPKLIPQPFPPTSASLPPRLTVSATPAYLDVTPPHYSSGMVSPMSIPSPMTDDYQGDFPPPSISISEAPSSVGGGWSSASRSNLMYDIPVSSFPTYDAQIWQQSHQFAISPIPTGPAHAEFLLGNSPNSTTMGNSPLIIA
ncbi:hypothetical protein BZG36_04804 [Bifiguratus adelaidae]|uniref:BZIP domain-containing protein n=1 Tax=Bifiguratus adelaidae TaxID=1938954 RepID=A0A261XUX5_9FUNG|nr:hypothetical protein BZG36_04804 [Bifiguratus adelaidae]